MDGRAHRARLLVELFPRQRILVLIHNTPVAAHTRLDTATGLEAGIVLLVGVEGLLGLDTAPAGHAPEREGQLCKLYMAMTRAGQHLVLLSCQRLAAPLECLFEQA